MPTGPRASLRPRGVRPRLLRSPRPRAQGLGSAGRPASETRAPPLPPPPRGRRDPRRTRTPARRTALQDLQCVVAVVAMRCANAVIPQTPGGPGRAGEPPPLGARPPAGPGPGLRARKGRRPPARTPGPRPRAPRDPARLPQRRAPRRTRRRPRSCYATARGPRRGCPADARRTPPAAGWLARCRRERGRGPPAWEAGMREAGRSPGEGAWPAAGLGASAPGRPQEKGAGGRASRVRGWRLLNSVIL